MATLLTGEAISYEASKNGCNPTAGDGMFGGILSPEANVSDV